MGISNYRYLAGLPPQNAGTLLVEGVVLDPTQIAVRNALPIGSNAGGLLEYLITGDPATAIRITGVTTILPPF
jgi:hypothetical protein